MRYFTTTLWKPAGHGILFCCDVFDTTLSIGPYFSNSLSTSVAHIIVPSQQSLTVTMVIHVYSSFVYVIRKQKTWFRWELGKTCMAVAKFTIYNFPYVTFSIGILIALHITCFFLIKASSLQQYFDWPTNKKLLSQ